MYPLRITTIYKKYLSFWLLSFFGFFSSFFFGSFLGFKSGFFFCFSLCFSFALLFLFCFLNGNITGSEPEIGDHSKHGLDFSYIMTLWSSQIGYAAVKTTTGTYNTILIPWLLISVYLGMSTKKIKYVASTHKLI